jgi:MYXO-CTERM domain-containing protein
MSYFPRIVRYGILAGALAVASGFAQDQNSGTATTNDQNSATTSPYTNGGGVNNSTAPNYNPNTNAYNRGYDYGNRGYDYGRSHSFGWLGLLGLAGLAGLRRRDRRVDVDRDRIDRTRVDTTDRTGRI